MYMLTICAVECLSYVDWRIDWAAFWILNQLNKCTSLASTLLSGIVYVSEVELYSLVTARTDFVKFTKKNCKIYKKCVDNLFSKFVPPNCTVFKAVQIPKLADKHKYSTCVYMFKIIKLQSCPTLQINLRHNIFCFTTTLDTEKKYLHRFHV